MTSSLECLDLLRAVREKYASVASYSDTGEVVTRFTDTGMVHRITFSTLYQRPSFFRFAFFRPHAHPPLGQHLTEHAAGHDGAVGYYVVKRPNNAVTLKSPISLNEAIARAAGISSGSAHTIGRLLLPEVQGESMLDLVDARRGEDVAIDGTWCYSIVARTSTGQRQRELCIEKDSYLLRKCITRSGGRESIELRENISIDSPQPVSLFEACARV
ncbi:MAG: hypothetical protein WAM21_06755 [Steroidobacteraceae bacterium]